MAKRPPIPADMERAILIECGHRCAIPTCRQVPLEISHIQPWSRCKTHAFENLIALCPTCHTRFDNGDIDRKSMRVYKLNLSLVNGRYGDLEQRVIRTFVKDRAIGTFWWFEDMEIMLLYLLEDGVLKATNQERIVGGLVQKLYELTVKGQEYIAQCPTN
jgi:HNH endonuclease